MKCSWFGVLVFSTVAPQAMFSQASKAQADMAIQNMRTHQLDSLSDLGKDSAKPASVPWKSLSAEQADDPTISAAVVHEDVPHLARKAAEKAEHLSKRNRHEEAIAEFRDALTIDPHYYEAANNLALELEIAAQPAEAEKILRELIRLAPAHVLAFGNLATLLTQQHRYLEAEAVCREALKVHPYSFRASFFLGTSLVNQGKWTEEAKRNLEYAQVRYPEASVLLHKWLTITASH